MLKKVEAPEPGLKRQIGPVALLFTGITGIIGSGWLFASLYAAQLAGPAAILSWLIGGGVALMLALVYAELGGMLPLAGAIARIPYFSHGAMSGFMAGWLCWIAYVATAPIEVAAVLQYASNYLPWLTTTIDGNRALTSMALPSPRRCCSAFVVINLAGVRWLARANVAVTSWKLAVPLLAATGLIVFGFDHTNFTDHGGFMPAGIDGVFAAVAGGGVVFSLFGFRTVIDMAGEARDPQRTVPIAMIGAVVISLSSMCCCRSPSSAPCRKPISPAAGRSLPRTSPTGRSPPSPPSSACRGSPRRSTSTPSSPPPGRGSPIPAPRRASTTRWPRTASCRASSCASTRRRCRCGRSPSTSSSAWPMLLPFPGWSQLIGFISFGGHPVARLRPRVARRAAPPAPRPRAPVPPASRRRHLGHRLHAGRLHRLLGRLADQLEGVRARHRRRRHR